MSFMATMGPDNFIKNKVGASTSDTTMNVLSTMKNVSDMFLSQWGSMSPLVLFNRNKSRRIIKFTEYIMHF